MVVSLQTPLSTKSVRVGQPFEAKLTTPMEVGSTVALPEGTVLKGEVVGIGESEKTGGKTMALELREAEVPDRGSESLDTKSVVLVAEPSTEDDLEKVAVGGVAGGVLGAIVGGGKGALIGVAAGAGTGAVVAIATRDEHLHLAPGQKIRFELEEPAELPLLASNEGR
jgi:hypothetical protein